MQTLLGTTELFYLLRAFLPHTKDLFRISLPKLYEFERQVKVEDV